jgi:hypothetical protein
MLAVRAGGIEPPLVATKRSLIDVYLRASSIGDWPMMSCQ